MQLDEKLGDPSRQHLARRPGRAASLARVRLGACDRGVPRGQGSGGYRPFGPRFATARPDHQLADRCGPNAPPRKRGCTACAPCARAARAGIRGRGAVVAAHPQPACREMEIAREEAQLSQEYGEHHPRILELRAEQQKLADRIAHEIDNVIANVENEVALARSRERAHAEHLREARGIRGDPAGRGPAARAGARGRGEPVTLPDAARPPQGDRAAAGDRPGRCPPDLAGAATGGAELAVAEAVRDGRLHRVPGARLDAGAAPGAARQYPA